MTTKSRGRRPPTPPPPAERRPPWVWIGVAVVVLVAAIVAIAASGGGDDGADDGSTAADVLQTRPVQVSGTPLAPFNDPAGDPAVGKTIPELRGASFDGTPISITAAGGPKLILFVAHWCPHCQKEVPLLVDHLRDAPMPSGIDLLTVSTSTSADRPNYPPSTWLRDEGWEAPVLADDDQSAGAAAFGLTGLPYFVAVDAGGKVVARTSGEISTGQFDQLVGLALGKAG
jgi:thiol-disulfide isomerase/thioredoxin